MHLLVVRDHLSPVRWHRAVLPPRSHHIISTPGSLSGKKTQLQLDGLYLHDESPDVSRDLLGVVRSRQLLPYWIQWSGYIGTLSPAR